MNEKKQPGLEELVDYPSVFVFRAMGEARPDIQERCTEAVEGTLGREVEAVELRASRKGNYCSVRLGAVVISADEIRAVYRALHAVEGIRLIL